MDLEKRSDKLIALIESVINDLTDSIPDIEKKIDRQLILFSKDLQLDQDRLANSSENMNLLNKLKQKIDNIILNDNYISKVSAFAKSFDKINDWHYSYFSDLVGKFSLPKVLDAIHNDAIDDAITSLTEDGIGFNVSSEITDVLRTNVRGGGQYVDYINQMREAILGNNKEPGKLLKYVKQITVDAVNTYSATVNSTIALDLGFEWFRITGSLLETSRPMCVEMSKIEFFHVSQIPELLQGIVNGVQTKLNKRTGLPIGFKENTTAENYMQNRNGWQCGHQFLGVPTSMVPQILKDRIG